MPWKPGANGKKDRDGQDVPESLIEIIVAKNRRGRTGPIEIYENGQMTCFAEEYFNQ
jgi:replicative DNA helicase